MEARTVLAKYIDLVTRLPESLFVPSSVNKFVASGEVSRPYWLFKFVKRYFIYWIIGRVFGLVSERGAITGEKNILWVNFSAPSLGDSLMDLSARVLLAERNVDLFTSKKNVKLYYHDRWFADVFDSPGKVKRNYDLVICDSFSPRVLAKKLRVAPLTPLVSMYGFLNGFDLNRTYFAFARMLDLLGKVKVDYQVKPYLTVQLDLQTNADLCIAVGGEWSFRIYRHWELVVEQLVYHGIQIHLVGGANGKLDHERLIRRFPSITSSVGNGLDEVSSEIANTPFFMGADGGLWHMACALNRPTVALFADCEIFDNKGVRVMRDTQDMLCETLYDDKEVSNIKPQDIVEAFFRLRRRAEIGH